MSPDRGQPCYTLTVASALVGMSPRTLRLYEQAGLIAPARTGGNQQRLYSEQDLQWLRCIRDMLHEEGLTVTAIRRLLDLIPCWEIRGCSPQQAALAAPNLAIPNMGQKGREAAESGETGPDSEGGPCGLVELRLVYGVREWGAILACSRCTHAERVLRKVAAKYGGRVTVTKVDIASDEAAEYGVLLPPAVLVDGELLTSGQGISEARLQKAVEERLKSKQ